MSKKEPFFREDAFQPFEDGFGSTDIVPWIEEQNAKLLSLEEANNKGHDELFDLVTTYQPSWKQIDALPRIGADFQHTLLPYSYDEHDEQSFEEGLLSDLVEGEVNRHMSGEKFLLSCDPRHFVALRLENFSYELVSAAAQNGGTNTHFVLFDEARNFWVVFCSEFPFLIVSQRGGGSKKSPLGRAQEFWVKYFEAHAARSIRLFEPPVIDFLNKTYLPRLQGYQDLPRPQ